MLPPAACRGDTRCGWEMVILREKIVILREIGWLKPGMRSSEVVWLRHRRYTVPATAATSVIELIEITPELLTQVGMAQFPQRNRFNLPDTLTRNTKLDADLLQRTVTSIL
jgi:hypothetical protein